MKTLLIFLVVEVVCSCAQTQAEKDYAFSDGAFGDDEGPGIVGDAIRCVVVAAQPPILQLVGESTFQCVGNIITGGKSKLIKCKSDDGLHCNAIDPKDDQELTLHCSYDGSGVRTHCTLGPKRLKDFCKANKSLCSNPQ